jgi:hypothetical protein
MSDIKVELKRGNRIFDEEIQNDGRDYWFTVVDFFQHNNVH